MNRFPPTVKRGESCCRPKRRQRHQKRPRWKCTLIRRANVFEYGAQLFHFGLWIVDGFPRDLVAVCCSMRFHCEHGLAEIDRKSIIFQIRFFCRGTSRSVCPWDGSDNTQGHWRQITTLGLMINWGQQLFTGFASRFGCFEEKSHFGGKGNATFVGSMITWTCRVAALSLCLPLQSW